MTIRELLIDHEGLRIKPYKCTAGKNTIGIGHNFDDNPLPPDIKEYLDKNGCITIEMVNRLFNLDIESATKHCHNLYPEFDSFSPSRQVALIDFIFNVGFNTAKTFINTNKFINIGDWDNAAANMKKSMWYRQVPHRAKDIIRLIKEG